MALPIIDFLKKFKTFVPQEKIMRDELIRVVKEETGILLSKENISFHNNMVFINTSPTIKNELFMRKKHLLSEMKKKMGDTAPHDIR
ncbi:MAG: hypothetical protein HYT28_00785 [Parcubacteria group bacterium]|nr:hypothetical protein [Parcubacteria group bacterium]